jgi:peptide deformylase
MSTTSIVHVPNEVLSCPAKTVVKFDKKLLELIKRMEQTLRATNKPKGVGLAAPQIGEPYRVFITRPTVKSEIRAFVNPEITKRLEPATPKKDDKKLEGCLSIPDIWGDVTRPEQVTIKYQDLEGKEHEEVITGFMATIVQHETDHTNGILFTQRVAEQKGKFFKSMTNEKGKEVLEEITLI